MMEFLWDIKARNVTDDKGLLAKLFPKAVEAIVRHNLAVSHEAILYRRSKLALKTVESLAYLHIPLDAEGNVVRKGAVLSLLRDAVDVDEAYERMTHLMGRIPDVALLWVLDMKRGIVPIGRNTRVQAYQFASFTDDGQERGELVAGWRSPDHQTHLTQLLTSHVAFMELLETRLEEPMETSIRETMMGPAMAVLGRQL